MIKYLAATLDWTAGFTMVGGVLMTMDDRPKLALGAIFVGYVATILARFLETYVN